MSFIIPLFYRLLYMSIIASVIGITLIILKKFTSKGFSAKYNYFMWIIFIVALIFPAVLQSRLSLYNIVDLSRVQNLYMHPEDYALKNNITKIETEEIDKNVELEKTEEVKKDSKIENADIAQVEVNEVVNKKDYFSLIKNIIPFIWFYVFLTLITFYITSYFVLKSKIGSEDFNNLKVKNILDRVKEELKIKREFKLIKQNYIKSPALIGIFNPKILVVDGIQEFSDKNLEYIFRHELSHYKRKDNITSSILAIIKIVYWFNPLVWIIIKTIRKDMELATDEMVIKPLDANERKEYCKLLVYLSSIYNSGFAEKALGIADDKTNLEKRISMVKITDKVSKHPVFSAFLVFIMIGLVCLVLYTNNYYERKLPEPPKVYIVNDEGMEKEFVLSSYTWAYKNEVKNFDMGFDEKTYDFTEANTIIVPHFSKYSIKINPTFEPKVMNLSLYNLENGEYKFIYNNVNTYDNFGKETEFYNESGVYLVNLILKDSRNNVAEYYIKVVSIDGSNITKIQSLLNTKISDTKKVEQIVQNLQMSRYLEKYEITENTLKLTYKYYNNDDILDGISTILFSSIDDLENVEFSFIHQNYNMIKYNKDTSKVENIETKITEPIVKSRNEILQKNLEQLKVLKGEY